jgi:hypothetical protein
MIVKIDAMYKPKKRIFKIVSQKIAMATIKIIPELIAE